MRLVLSLKLLKSSYKNNLWTPVLYMYIWTVYSEIRYAVCNALKVHSY